jgi:glycosyltransferase 2 family protein
VKSAGAQVAGADQAVQDAATARPRLAGRWINLALLGAGIVILIVFAATTNFPQVGEALRTVRIPLLPAAVAALVIQIFLKAYRWQFMVHRLTGTTISMRFAAISVVSGVAAGSVTPGRSFELAKAIMLKGSYDTPLAVSASAMIVERMLDMGFIVLLFLLSAAFVPSRMVLASRVLALMIAIVICAFGLVVTAPLLVQGAIAAIAHRLPLPASLRGRSLQLLETFFSTFLLLRRQRTLWLLLILTAVVAALDLVRVFTIFRAMGILLGPPLVTFAYLGAAMLGMALLIPGGVGVTEVSMAGLIALLSPGAVPPALARSAVLIDRFLSYYLLVLVGAALLVAYHRFRHKFE